jgi:hypothetical protein
MKPTNSARRARRAPTRAPLTAFTTSAALCCALAAASAAEPAAAEVPTFTAGFRLGGVLTRDRGLDPVSDSDFNFQGGAFLDVEVLSPTGPDHLSVGLEWLVSSHSARIFRVFDAFTRADYLHLTATYRYDVAPWLAPFARASFGVGFHSLSLNSSRYTAQDDWAFAGQAGAGVEVFTPTKVWDAISFGLRLEGGYTFRAQPQFAIAPAANTPEDATPIPIAGADLGTMPNNGFTLTVDLFARF